jgi:hypothetical protein
MKPSEAKSRKSASQAIAQFLQTVYFESIPVSPIAAILEQFGFNADQLHGIYCGDTGRVCEQVGAKSLFENSMESCFRGNGRMARRDEGEYPSWICDREATKPDGHFRENPPGGGPFAWDLCWLGRQSPLWGCSDLAALVPAKISRRRAPCNFQTGSKTWLTIAWYRMPSGRFEITGYLS